MISDQDFQNLKREIEELKDIFYKDNFSAFQVFKKQIRLADGINLELGSYTGTKIGTETTQKIGFFGKVPKVQPGFINKPNGGDVVDIQARAAVSDVITVLEDLGIIEE